MFKAVLIIFEVLSFLKISSESLKDFYSFSEISYGFFVVTLDFLIFSIGLLQKYSNLAEFFFEFLDPVFWGESAEC